eukprot:NODE_154_length_15322_cov_0.584510.p12 type:complete len:230 gc:universal NODE_154_length_15322_cov_0.584510:5354-4665(-)
MIYQHIAKGYLICLTTFIAPVYLLNYFMSLVSENSNLGFLLFYLLLITKYMFLCFYNILSALLLIPYYSKLVSLVEEHFNLQKLSVSMGFLVKNIFYSIYTYSLLYSIYLLLMVFGFLKLGFVLNILLFIYWQLYYGIACLSSIYPMSNAIDLLQTHPSFLVLVAPLSYMTCTGSFEDSLLYYQLLVIPILILIRLIHGYMPVYRVEWLGWLKKLVYILIEQNNKKAQE